MTSGVASFFFPLFSVSPLTRWHVQRKLRSSFVFRTADRNVRNTVLLNSHPSNPTVFLSPFFRNAKAQCFGGSQGRQFLTDVEGWKKRAECLSKSDELRDPMINSLPSVRNSVTNCEDTTFPLVPRSFSRSSFYGGFWLRSCVKCIRFFFASYFFSSFYRSNSWILRIQKFVTEKRRSVQRATRFLEISVSLDIPESCHLLATWCHNRYGSGNFPSPGNYNINYIII